MNMCSCRTDNMAESFAISLSRLVGRLVERDQITVKPTGYAGQYLVIVCEPGMSIDRVNTSRTTDLFQVVLNMSDYPRTKVICYEARQVGSSVDHTFTVQALSSMR